MQRALYYDDFLKLCVKSQKDKSELKKFSYVELLTASCMAKGMAYDSILDACSKVIYPEPQQIQQVRAEQGRAMCRNFDMQWDPQFGFCVMMRKPYETATPEVPWLPTGHPANIYYNVCLTNGMHYIRGSEQCSHFPAKMNKQEQKELQETYRPYIDFIYSLFCKESLLTYDADFRGCVFTKTYVKYLPKEYSDVFPNYCFVRGLLLAATKRGKPSYEVVSRCLNFPDSPEARRKLRANYNFPREMFLTHRCPVYSEYSKELGFCIRRKPKVFDLHFEKKRMKFIFLSFSKLVSRSRSSKPSDEDIECCIMRGLFYSEVDRKCIQYRVRPTTSELAEYKQKYKERRRSVFATYCETQNLQHHPVHDICVQLDQF